MKTRSWAALCAVALLAGCAQDEPAKFTSPTAALHDPVDDVYLVANMRPDGGAGYIVSVSPEDGTCRMWGDGAATGVDLRQPRGMALQGDVLWVADGGELRRFDRRTRAALRSVAVAGAEHLWDVAAGPDGSVYACDAGLDAQGRATGTDAIFKVDADGAVTVLAQGPALGQPTGLTARAAGLYVVGWRDGSFYEIDYRGAQTDLARAPEAGLCGLVRVEPAAEAGAGSRPAYYASSRQGAAIYRFGLMGGGAALPTRVEEPGRLGYDARRRRLLVPLTAAERLHVEPL